MGQILDNAKRISRKVGQVSAHKKNEILENLADALIKNSAQILKENKKDILLAEKNGLGERVDRLLLTQARIEDMAKEVKKVVSLRESVGEVLSEKKMEWGGVLQQVRVPLGVVAIIYESRPNVTIDAATLAFKSGNVIVLKGGKEALYSNRVLVNIFRKVLKEYGIEDAVQLLDGATRLDTMKLLKAKGKIDVLIPRGGKGLIDFVAQNAQVPVIQTGASVVHTFVDESADFQMAENIVLNEKLRRTSVCNALDTLLIHEKIASDFLPLIIEKLENKGVEVFMITESDSKESKEIFSTEWLDKKISIRVVQDIDEALNHIEKYSLGHSESIVTENIDTAEKFLNEVDAACVYHNASTCFSDGGQFGFGAEIGISTQKLHVRGPFALEGLTSTKWKIRGKGEVRK